MHGFAPAQGIGVPIPIRGMLALHFRMIRVLRGRGMIGFSFERIAARGRIGRVGGGRIFYESLGA